jgi:hypothetical protein
MPTQLALFDDMGDGHDTRPLPLIIASQHGFMLQTQDNNGTTMYAVLDWVRGVARADNASRLWSDLKIAAKKSERHTYDSIVSLPYMATDGKTYKRDYADEQTLYQIVQYMRAETGIRDQIIKFLAKAGVVLDLVRRDARAADALTHGLDQHHGKARADNIAGRNLITDKLQEHHITGKPDYAGFTIAEYETLFGAGKRELCRLLAIPEDSRSLRDNLNTYALLALTTAEVSASDLMDRLGRKLTTTEQIQIARDVCTRVRPFFDDMAASVGQILTGKKVLK